MNVRNIVGDDIIEIEHFLSGEECTEFIEYAEEKGFKPAAVILDGQFEMRTDIRNNEKVSLDDPHMAAIIWESLEQFLPESELVAHSLNERMRFYKYSNNQRFTRHKDQIFELGELVSGHTFLLYLNSNFAGGETYFSGNDIPDITVIPKQGSVLLFDKRLRHKGNNVPEGTKYVLRSDVMYLK
jgi:predicted 2-oxoglutarate/Fe(II)-dependent dioxygenase YbiX